jgi:hypothetical protein
LKWKFAGSVRSKPKNIVVESRMDFLSKLINAEFLKETKTGATKSKITSV